MTPLSIASRMGKMTLVLAAQVSHGGHARAERGAHRLHPAHDERGVAFGGDVAVGVGLGAAVYVGVRLDETGQDGASPYLDLVDRLIRVQAQLVERADLGDAAAIDEHGAVFDGWRARPVNQPVRLQEQLQGRTSSSTDCLVRRGSYGEREPGARSRRGQL